MREIKFRAWNDDKQTMDSVKGLEWYINYDTEEPIMDIVTNGARIMDTLHLMQFTGLHDKNGKEIYEGDVVDIYETDTASTRYGFILYNNCVVDFKSGAFCYRIPVQMSSSLDGRESFPMYLETGRDIVVLGNIYENPELLKPTKD